MWSAVRVFGFWPIGGVVAIGGLAAYAVLAWIVVGEYFDSVGVPPVRPAQLAVIASLWCVVLVALIVWRAREMAPSGPGGAAPVSAFLSLIGASGIGVVASGLLAPLVVVTVATNAVLSLPAWIAFVVGWLWGRIRGSIGMASTEPDRAAEPALSKRPSFSVFPGP